MAITEHGCFFMCLVSLSCWTIYLQPSLSFLAAATRISANIAWYFVEFILTLILMAKHGKTLMTHHHRHEMLILVCIPFCSWTCQWPKRSTVVKFKFSSSHYSNEVCQTHCLVLFTVLSKGCLHATLPKTQPISAILKLQSYFMASLGIFPTVCADDVPLHPLPGNFATIPYFKHFYYCLYSAKWYVYPYFFLLQLQSVWLRCLSPHFYTLVTGSDRMTQNS